MIHNKSIHPSEVLPAISRKMGVLFDVREAAHEPVLVTSHFRVPLSDIEKFMAGSLSGERVRTLVSTLIYLSSKWRSAYVIADSELHGLTAIRCLEKLGFKDALLIKGGGSGVFGIPLSVAPTPRPAISGGFCTCI